MPPLSSGLVLPPRQQRREGGRGKALLCSPSQRAQTPQAAQCEDSPPHSALLLSAPAALSSGQANCLPPTRVETPSIFSISARLNFTCVARLMSSSDWLNVLNVQRLWPPIESATKELVSGSRLVTGLWRGCCSSAFARL